MASAETDELVDRFDEFYRTYYEEEIADLAQRYPNEQRSLFVEWTDLRRFDEDLAEDVRSQPDQLLTYAEEALRLFDLPYDISLGQAHVRVRGLPDTTDIREIRAEHVNRLESVRGIVRKATGVKPKVRVAAFECQRCGTLTRIPQEGGSFQEPHECQGCERQGPFRINFDQSEFIDAQKLRIQESPEGLRGGETPENIDVNIEDDIAGRVSPGDTVRCTGVLRMEQEQSGGEPSALFDVYMEGISVEAEEEQFDEMDITEEDERRIVELSDEPDIYSQMVDSIAPSIYGHENAKLAMVLQLFSGVTKNLPDGSRTRGDTHMLLIGDPGTGKCVAGDTSIHLSDGTARPIRDIVEGVLEDPSPVDDGFFDEANFSVPSVTEDGTIVHRTVTRVWKRESPEVLYRITTESGHSVTTTPTHPLFVQDHGGIEARIAEDLEGGDFLAEPREVVPQTCDQLEVSHRRSKSPNAVRFDPPEAWNASLARMVGYIVADGCARLNENDSGDLRITNNDRQVLDDIERCLDRLGLPWAENDSRPSKDAKEVRCSSSEFVSFLQNLEPAILERSDEQRVPEPIFGTSPPIRANFLRGYIEGEGPVSTKEREIAVSSTSHKLLKDVRRLLLSLGIQSQLHDRAGGSWRLRISGPNVDPYLRSVGFTTDRKSKRAIAHEATPENPDRDVVPNVSEQLNEIRTALRMSQFECGVPRTTYQHYERGDRNPSRDSLRSVLTAFENRVAELKEWADKDEPWGWEDVEALREKLSISQQAISERVDVTRTAISYYERNADAIPDGGVVFESRGLLAEELQRALAVESKIERLRQLVESDIAWDRIESIEQIEPEDEWVYDLEVNGTHNYIAGGLLSHNSALLQYVRNIAPRSVYTSGKGSSAAGLTAAAVRDDFGDGQQWSLEAGALVLADQGIAAVDELDKMDPGDRSAMHEGLEAQEISISKAGINATLKARCSLLGAANPQYGRFDPYESMGEQIDLEPALISRFDLIFTMTDQPDEEQDRNLAEHILETNYAGELSTQLDKLSAPEVSEQELEAASGTVTPAIDPDLFRKYVAFAQQTCYPRMTDEARSAIQEFYVDLRSRGTDEDAPVPVTARKLEALVRLSEASARVRLSDTVELEDAERVIELVRSCLQDIGVDPETGQYDADVIETGRSKTQRDRVRNIKEIIRELQGEHDEGAPVEDVLARANEVGIERSKAEHQIQKLKDSGEVFTPKSDILRLV